jgi:nucleotide-binding universal stress UspA family protein
VPELSGEENAMMKILVGVDGSDESRQAADFAARIAQATGSGLELAYVLPLLVDTGPDANLNLAVWQQHRTEKAQIVLYEMSQGAPRPNTPVETSLLEGGPAEALAEEAKRDDIRMVIVGHRGRGAAARVFLGSVADRLVQICPKPVLVVR